MCWHWGAFWFVVLQARALILTLSHLLYGEVQLTCTLSENRLEANAFTLSEGCPSWRCYPWGWWEPYFNIAWIVGPCWNTLWATAGHDGWKCRILHWHAVGKSTPWVALCRFRLGKAALRLLPELGSTVELAVRPISSFRIQSLLRIHSVEAMYYMPFSGRMFGATFVNWFTLHLDAMWWLLLAVLGWSCWARNVSVVYVHLQIVV